MIFFKEKKGVSTAEAIVVIVVVAVAVAVLVTLYINYTGTAKAGDCAVQRATIERCFKALYLDDEKLRACKTQEEILELTGPDVIGYMIRQDAYTGGKNCLSTGIPYSLKFEYKKPSKKGQGSSCTVKFICPCSPGFDGIEALQEYCRQRTNGN